MYNSKTSLDSLFSETVDIISFQNTVTFLEQSVEFVILWNAFTKCQWARKLKFLEQIRTVFTGFAGVSE